MLARHPSGPRSYLADSTVSRNGSLAVTTEVKHPPCAPLDRGVLAGFRLPRRRSLRLHLDCDDGDVVVTAALVGEVDELLGNLRQREVAHDLGDLRVLHHVRHAVRAEDE